jgi:hypothetical protein
MILAGHIAGIPVEETLASFAPVGAVGVGALVYGARARADRVRRAGRLRGAWSETPHGASSREQQDHGDAEPNRDDQAAQDLSPDLTRQPGTG